MHPHQNILRPSIPISNTEPKGQGKAKAKGKAKANKEAEDNGDDGESENEGPEFDEWEDRGDTSNDFLTAGEGESAAGASHGGIFKSSAIAEKPAGKGRGPAGTWLGLLDLTDSRTGELGEYGRITMRGDRKKRKFDEVIDLIGSDD